MRNFWGMRPARSPAELGLTADDRRKLEWALRQARDARHFRRLLAINLIAEGKGPGEAAHLWRLLDLSPQEALRKAGCLAEGFWLRDWLENFWRPP
ncbi:hypothetical protein [Myxococcus xanthus]|uniref:hypothetical protein n=1 Tax=Myxococcus xanthus TaxID=34 RepID=UPI001CED0856|nr:hypothetical protein [Myxococcus xanthus]